MWLQKTYESMQHSVPEVESSRTSLASRTSSRTHFEVLGLGLEGQVLGFGLEASSPRKLACPRLGNSTIFWNVKILRSPEKFLWRLFFFGDRLKNFCEDLFFFWRALALCVLGPWPWSRAFLSLASRVSVLGKAVLGLGLGFFLCPWPWPRALCPRLHLCSVLPVKKLRLPFDIRTYRTASTFNLKAVILKVNDFFQYIFKKNGNGDA